MGSSAKKKREKKKDFQVCHYLQIIQSATDTSIETEAKGWESTSKSSQPDQHQLPIKRLEIFHSVVRRLTTKSSYCSESAILTCHSPIYIEPISAPLIFALFKIRFTETGFAGISHVICILSTSRLSSSPAIEHHPTQDLSFDP